MANQTPVRITVLISGNGTNLQALIDARDDALENCSIVRVISNRMKAYGLHRAKEASIPTHYHNLIPYRENFAENARTEYDKDLAAIVLADKPDLVVCAGWMSILADTFLDPLAEAHVPIINLHPALPGQFNGAKAIERAHKAWLEGKIEKTGIMIHYVESEVDMGKPILVEEIPFNRGVDENIENLEQRIHGKEHKLIVLGTRMVAEEMQKRNSNGVS
ncbi:hypothetical protein HO133_009607 [Letharia lupina]|uniref:Phosphoribosylglycinamide formyltransferase n=1 Tax=Letharia lupina TaxID=560253 RepID=A0A8H6FEK3_9LECA|nr:uncharacterized protein HO133_009607 [Letharia lupina]KAF6225607.1 hypothetical protein HO133_009607 [Letharia lupina]